MLHSIVGHVHLKNWFFHFLWPFQDHEEVIPRNRGVVLEKMVMGEDHESTDRGPATQNLNQNLRASDNLAISLTMVLGQSKLFHRANIPRGFVHFLQIKKVY